MNLGKINKQKDWISNYCFYNQITSSPLLVALIIKIQQI